MSIVSRLLQRLTSSAKDDRPPEPGPEPAPEPERYPKPGPIVRREIWGLERDGPFDPITLAYAKAIQVMQARPATDPTSWAYQAAIHGAFAAPPPGADWNQCQHQGWFFLPWHRMYLYFFERIVRAAVKEAGGPDDFAIPYWNYDLPFPGNTIPPAFRTEPTLPDGTANPLFLPPPRRPAGLMNGGQLDPTLTSPQAALDETRFTTPVTGFGGGRLGPQHFGDFADTGAVESTPHNDIHVALGGRRSGQCQGGLMIDPNCAALDPIFWLHHSNVDRLWNVWLASGGGRVNPPDPSWNTAPFVFHDETGAAITMTAAEVLDSADQLGYVYDDVPSFEMSAPLGEEEPAGPPELVAATDESFTLAGGSASVAISVPASTQPLVESAAAPGPKRVLISVEDITADVNPGVVYGVYLNLPGEGGADRREHHVGNVSLFGIEKMNDPDTRHEGAPGFRHLFDATKVAGKLTEQGLWDPSAVTVTFEPIGPLPPPGEEDTWDDGRAEEPPVPPVKIGRVSLFVTS